MTTIARWTIDSHLPNSLNYFLTSTENSNSHFFITISFDNINILSYSVKGMSHNINNVDFKPEIHGIEEKFEYDINNLGFDKFLEEFWLDERVPAHAIATLEISDILALIPDEILNQHS